MNGVRAGRNTGRTVIAVAGIVALAALATLVSARSGSAAAPAPAAVAPTAGVDPALVGSKWRSASGRSGSRRRRCDPAS